MRVLAAGFEPKGNEELNVRVSGLAIWTARRPSILWPLEIRLCVAQLLPAITATGTRSAVWVVSVRCDLWVRRWSGILET